MVPGAWFNINLAHYIQFNTYNIYLYIYVTDLELLTEIDEC